MDLGLKQVILVQYFPATGNYIVHYQGGESEHFIAENDIHSVGVNAFINECLKCGYYHENTVHMHTSQVSGKNTVPLRQIIYCKAFTAPALQNTAVNTPEVSINWALWSPGKRRLTVNSGVLSMSKDFLIPSLQDAPDGVREFMSACTGGSGIALSDHRVEPDYSGAEVAMLSVDEYFFSTGKVIYGFQHNRVQNVTREEAEEIGIAWLGN